MPAWLDTLALGLIATVLFMLALRPLATACGLVDRPGGRKLHSGEVPVVGGLAMALGFASASALDSTAAPMAWQFTAALVALVVIGALDDRFNIAPGIRIFVQALAALLMATGAGIVALDLGELYPGIPLALGALAVPFTVVAVVSAVNAFNMFDGSDGMAGAQALVGLVFLGAASVIHNSSRLMPELAGMAGCVVGFLLFNWPTRRARVSRAFMGDAGSTMLGFALAWWSIELSQGSDRAVSFGVILWLFALPLYDLLSSVVRRVSRGRSPFEADAEHLHHMLRRCGFTSQELARLVLVASCILAACGLGAHLLGVSSGVLIALWCICGAGYYLFFSRGLLGKRAGLAHIESPKIVALPVREPLREPHGAAAPGASYNRIWWMS